PQRVARAEPARRRPAREHGIPETARVLGHAEELATVLTRVAGAVHHHLDAVDLVLRERESLRRLEPEAFDRPRPLHGEERVVVGAVAHLRAANLVLLEP